MQTFEANGKTYCLEYTIGRVEQYENATDTSIMETMLRHGGNFSVSQLTMLVAYGLKLEDGGFVSPKQGREMASRLIEENGYFPVLKAVSEALERDCGFFFTTSTEEPTP